MPIVIASEDLVRHYARMGERNARRLLARLWPCVVLLALAACSTPPDPISQPSGSGAICMPASVRPVTEGGTVLRNTGSAPAVLTKVVLRNAQGMQLVDTRVFVFPDVGAYNLIGALNHYPPATGPTNGTSDVIPWSAGSAVPGAVLPAETQMLANVVVGLSRNSAGTGRSDGLDVYYTSAGVDYVYHGQVAIELSDGPCS